VGADWTASGAAASYHRLSSSKATRMSEPLAPIRKLPEIDPRMEDGPVQFGEDWPGLLLRGDTAMNFAYHLEVLLATNPAVNQITLEVVQGLVSDLQSCNLVRRREPLLFIDDPMLPTSLKLGMTVEFHPKVFQHPYAPHYDAYKGHRFEVIAFHPLGHVEITCVDDPSVRVKGHVHDDELVEK